MLYQIGDQKLSYLIFIVTGAPFNILSQCESLFHVHWTESSRVISWPFDLFAPHVANTPWERLKGLFFFPLLLNCFLVNRVCDSGREVFDLSRVLQKRYEWRKEMTEREKEGSM
jgi:hypothetical protein